MTTLTVGTGQQYSTIAAAVAATQDGDTVLVQAGTYTNDFFYISHKITLQSVGGLAVINATAQPGNGKGAIVVDNDATIDGFGITGVRVPDANGAGIRYEAGNLVLRNSVIWNNQNGILANADPNGTILIDHSEFSANGAGGTGYTHNIYINGVASLTVQDSYFHDVQVGHEIKSRALSTTIIRNRIQDNVGGTGSYSIDLPNGGAALIQGNTIEKGSNTENNFTIHYGGEGGPYAGSSLTVSGNTIVSDNPNATVLLNQTAIPVALTGNQLYGFPADRIASGPVTQSGNTTLSTEPTLDLSTRAPSVLPPPAYVPPPVVPAPDLSSGTVLTSFGPGGAVTASGHVLTVGHSGAEFTSLQAAVAAAVDGDTIEVAAGTYVNDFAVVTHKVVIEGVGGIARFVQQNDLPQAAGILVVDNDATIKNMEFTGTSTWNGHAAGIHVNAGNVTIVNTLIDHNEVGLIAEGRQTTLSIYNSEIGLNGNVDRDTNNVQIGQIESLTIKDSYIHGATTGHEVFDDAFNTDIENTRIIDGDGIGASFLLDLAQGGNALLANNRFVKGNASQNSILVHVGGEGTTYANSAVRIDGNTLVTQLANGYHPYTYFIAGAVGTTLPPITADGNVFVGGVAGSQQLTNATGSNNGTADTATIDLSSPIDPAAAPPLFAAPAGPDTVTLRLNEDKADTDAQFMVSVDGQAVGGGVVTVGRGHPGQVVALSGSWGAGSHQVTVSFLNQQTGGGGGAYNLYVQSVSLGLDSAAPAYGLNGYGPFTATLMAPAVVPPPVQTLAAPGAAPEPVGSRDPAQWFDSGFYLAQNPDVAAAHFDPLSHFEQYGWKEGRDPSLVFSDTKYLAANPDVAGAEMDPLIHYARHGQFEGRATFLSGGAAAADPLVDAAYYDRQLGASLLPEGTAANEQAAASYAASGWQKGLNPDALFDTNFYLSHNPDVAAAHMDPLYHYETYGWKEGRDPSAGFSTDRYLAGYADVKAAGFDPLLHYVEYGRSEGRTAFGG